MPNANEAHTNISITTAITDLQSQFCSTNPPFLLTDAIISSKTNPCRGSMSKKGSNGEH